MLPVGDPREQDLVQIAEDCLERLGLLRRRLREPRTDLAGAHLCEHRQVRDPLQVVRGPVDGLMAILPESRHFLTRDQGLVLTICSLVSQARRAWPIPSVA